MVAAPLFRVIDDRRARLRVVQEPERQPAQDCAACVSSSNCWEKGIDPRVIVLNLVVCRMKRGIAREDTTRLFLSMIRPKLMQLALHATKGTRKPTEDALHDFETEAYEAIVRRYEIGEVAYPLHFLFGFPNGALRRFAASYRDRLVRHDVTHASFDVDGIDPDRRIVALNASATRGTILSPPPSAMCMPTFDEDIDDKRVTAKMDLARFVLEDGVTLTTAEYRVLRYSLDNARDGSRRLLNGLHVHLARILGVPRTRVAKLYSDATEKLINAVRRLTA